MKKFFKGDVRKNNHIRVTQVGEHCLSFDSKFKVKNRSCIEKNLDIKIYIIYRRPFILKLFFVV